ncbi:MAG: protoporphyrinogen oxidase [Mariniphaga sp.]
MEKQLNPKVIIIGAGLTGLVTAHYLIKNGISVTLVEKNSRPGGVIQSIKEQGFTIESGPNTGVVSHPEIVELFEDLAGSCKMAIANPEAKKRLIWKDGKWHALPSGLIDGIRTPLFTFGDKLRILGEPFRKRGTNPDESVAGLVLRRLGKSFLDYAVDPFISGIYAGDPGTLITRFALPKLYNLEQKYGSFIGGSIKKGREPKEARSKKATREVFSAEGGLQNLIDALVKSIGIENILLDCRDVVVNPVQDGFQISLVKDGNAMELTTEKVVSTVGGKQIDPLFPFIERGYLQAIGNLEYAKVIQVAMGYNQWKGININAFGGLVPSKENRRILGVLFPSSFFNGRAPFGGALLSVFLGGIKHGAFYDYNDEEIKALVDEEIGEMLNVNGVKPDLLKIFRYQHAIPQYTATSEQRLKAIEFIQHVYPGLILAGNINDGIGMGDRIKQGRGVAEKIIND